MYVLAPNQPAEKYPYSIGDLRKDHPNTSFPRNPSLELLAEFHVYPVVMTGAPEHDPATQVVEQGMPVRERVRTAAGQFVGDDPATAENEAWRWVTSWTVRDKTQDELAADNEAQAASVRSERNARIAACDWTQLDDSPVSNAQKMAWAQYRQALRDMPQQAGFPWVVDWPSQP